mgnify:FL=1
MELPSMDLDAKGFDVYEAIYEHGGEAVTTEIKGWTGIEKNAIVHYRLDKLEDEGIIEIGVGEAAGDRTPPKKAELTEKGRELAENGLFDEEEPTIVERMDRCERRMKAVEGEFQDLSDEFRSWRYDEEEDREVEIRDLLDRLEKFERLLEGVPDDALEEALQVADRVDDLDGELTTKAKYVSRNRSFDQDPDGDEYRIGGRDVAVAVENLEREISQITNVLEREGMKPRDGTEFLSKTGGIWG